MFIIIVTSDFDRHWKFLAKVFLFFFFFFGSLLFAWVPLGQQNLNISLFLWLYFFLFIILFSTGFFIQFSSFFLNIFFIFTVLLTAILHNWFHGNVRFVRSAFFCWFCLKRGSLSLCLTPYVLFLAHICHFRNQNVFQFIICVFCVTICCSQF